MTSSPAPASMQRHASGARTALRRICRLDIDSEPGAATNTALLCTIGPASNSRGVLADMLAAGMGVARLNLSHGSLDEHREALRLLRAADRRHRRLSSSSGLICPPLAVAVDTRGCEIRTGPVAGAAVHVAIETGSLVRVSCDVGAARASTRAALWLNFPDFARLAKPGQVVYIDDGLLRLRVIKAQPAEAAALCHVEVGGPLAPGRGVCLPGMDTGLPELAPCDLADLAALADEPSTRIDIVLASFVHSAEGVRRLRAAAAGGMEPQPLVVAKIGDLKGLRALDEILAEADGVLVARGDLGSELPQEKVFIAQKYIMAKCSATGKASVCATHLLDSMLDRPRPTRAEASDVANAVMDGADCLMLSAETAIGRYPVESVQTLAKISREAEAALQTRQQTAMLKRQLRGPANPLESSAMAACEAAVRCHAAAIVVSTDHWQLPRLAAMYRPPCPILVACPDAAVCRGLSLWHGLHALHYDKPPEASGLRETQARIKFAAAYGQSRGLLGQSCLTVVLVEKSATNSSDVLSIVPAEQLLAKVADGD